MSVLAVSAGLGLFGLVFPKTFRSGFIQQSVLTLISLAVCDGGWIACEKIGAQGRMRWLAFPANVVFGLAFVGVIVLIWIPLSRTYSWQFESQIQKSTLTAIVLGVTLAGGGLLGMIKAHHMSTRIVQRWTIRLGAVLCALSVLLIWEAFPLGAVFSRVYMVLLILTVAGAPATLVLRRIEIATLAQVAEAGLPSRIRVALTCPRCDLQQEMASGGAVCKGCGLAITIKVAEPVCRACGYSLAGLTGSVCPECGDEIPADLARLAGQMRKAERSAETMFD